jgi:hypothetical protein
MRRVVYCPSQEFLSEAEKISKDSNLPINIGESLELSYLDFDRSIIQIVCIPEVDKVFFSKNVQKNFHQIIRIYDDFSEFNKSIYIDFNKQKIKPNILEKHYVKFLFQCDKIGEQKAFVCFEDAERKIEFNVY